MEKTLEFGLSGLLAWAGIGVIYRALLYPALQLKCRYRLSQIRDEIFFAVLDKKLDDRSKAYRALDFLLQLNFVLANMFSNEEFFSPVLREPERVELGALINLIEQNENHLLRAFFRELVENMMAWIFAEHPLKAVSFMFLRLFAFFSDRAQKMVKKQWEEPFNEARSLVLTRYMSC